MKRLLSFVLSLLLLFSMCSVTSFAAEEKETVIITGSDFQPKDGFTAGQKRLQELISSLQAHGITQADNLFFVGDYSGTYVQADCETGLSIVRKEMGAIVTGDMYFTQGNHDQAATAGLSEAGAHDNDVYGLYIVHEDDYEEWGSYNQAAVDALDAYLQEKVAAEWDKPIFILNHIPLHWGNRTMKDGSGSNGYKFFKVINDAAATGLNIFYIFGHNHSSGYDDFLGGSSIYLKKGDTMRVANGTKHIQVDVTLNFTYMNAGYTGYYSTDEATADNTLTLSVLRVKGNEVVVTRYDSSGVHNLKSAGIQNAKYSEEGYHAVPNPTVYPSSRKVTATDDVEVETPIPSVLVNVSLTKLPDKTTYLVGEELDLTGLEMTLEYSDGTTEIITEGYKTRGFQSITTGTRNLTVSYEGFSDSFEYEVVEQLPDEPVDPPVDPAKNGWVNEDGNWAYYENGIKITNKWMLDSVGWCYVGADGYCVTDKWVADSHGWCYLDGNGRMVTNKWVKDSVGWCYVGADGYCVTNKWVADSHGWCYLDGSGRMVTNKWVMDSVGWCYVGADGYCVTNKWMADSKGWCYLDASGRMVTNKWIKDSVGWCYIGKDGYCLINTWKQDSKGWCFLDENGRMAISMLVVDEEGIHYVDENGYKVYDYWLDDGYGIGYIDVDGNLVVNTWVSVGSDWYFVGPYGYILVDQTATIDGKEYTFAADGKLIA